MLRMEPHEDGNSVIVDGRIITGFLADDRPCQFCQGVPSVDFDASACPSCNRWLQEACSDPACDRRPGRPAAPFGEAADPSPP